MEQVMSEFFSKNKNIVIILLIALIIFVLSMNGAPVGSLNDDAVYIVCARAMTAGYGYTQIEDPRSPPGRYPWGFSLLLAPLVALLYPHVWFLKLYALFFSLLSVYIIYVYFSRRHSEEIGLAVALVFAFNPTVLEYCGSVMSDMPYVCISFLALFLLEKDDGSREFIFTRVLSIALVLAFAFWLRVSALTLFFAASCFLLSGKHYRKLAFTAIVFCLCALFMFKFTNCFAFYQKGHFEPAVSFSLGQIAWSNVKYYLFNSFYLIQGHHMIKGINFYWRLPLIITLTGLLAWGAIVFAGKKRSSLLLLYTGFYLLSLIVYTCFDRRFLIPVMPILYYFIISGVAKIAGTRMVKTVPVVLGALLIAFNIYPDLFIMKAAAGEKFKSSPFPGGYAWLKENVPATRLIMSDHPPGVYLYTGLKGMVFVPDPGPYARIKNIYEQGADYLFFNSYRSFPSHTQVNPSLEYGELCRNNPHRFEKVFAGNEDEVVIYQVRGDGKAYLAAFKYFIRARELYEGKQMKAAVESLQNCLRTDGNFLEALKLRSVIYLEQERYDQSVSDLNKVLTLQPGCLDARLVLSQAYSALGQKKNAREELDRARSIAEKAGNAQALHFIQEQLEKLHD